MSSVLVLCLCIMIHCSKGVRGTVLCLLLLLPFLLAEWRVELTAGPQPPQISKAQRRSTVAGVIMLGDKVARCRMRLGPWFHTGGSTLES